MNPVVTIPWRPNGDLQRTRNFNAIRGRFEELFGYRVEAVDPPGAVFNRAVARNVCIERARELEFEVAIVCDADCWVPETGLRAALANIEIGWTGLHYPFENCLYLQPAETEAFLEHGFEPDRPAGYASGGCYVCRVDDWDAIGGMDERFETWGGEDDAFYVAAATMLETPRHHAGTMYHLAHGRDDIVAFGSPQHHGNLTLLARYTGASGNKELMRQLVEEARNGRPRGTAQGS